MIQLQVLNYILQNKDISFLLLNNIDNSFFRDYKQEFDFIKNHYDTYGTIPDIATFVDKFSDFDVIQVNESTQYLIEQLYSDRNRRKLAEVFNKVREQLNNGDTDGALTTYLTAQDRLVKAQYFKSVDIFKDISRYDKYIEKCNDYTKYYIKTGFDELDKLIGGWDRNEELATIVARPGTGKSWILLRCALAAAQQGLTVGIYSGEMSEIKVGYRLDTLLSHISNGKIIHGNESIQVEYKRYIDTMQDRIKGTIKILTPNMINGPAGVTALRAFIEKDNLDILCVDQHSLLEDDRHAKNPVERAANISKDLKNLQVAKKIPIIAVSQQNRESTESGISTAHVAQSDRISQDSTIILFLEQKDNTLKLYLVKARDAVNNKTLSYAIDLDKGIFTFIPTETDGVSETDCEQLRQEFDDNTVQGDNVF